MCCVCVQDGETVEEIEAAVKTRLKEIKKRRRRIRVGTQHPSV